MISQITKNISQRKVCCRLAVSDELRHGLLAPNPTLRLQSLEK